MATIGELEGDTEDLREVISYLAMVAIIEGAAGRTRS
jgi:hypothetical protein